MEKQRRAAHVSRNLQIILQKHTNMTKPVSYTHLDVYKRQRESWFIKMTAVKDDLIRNNNTINWIPESIGKGRFGDWLENVQDWGISRNRYWGTPLNIWQCECGHMHSIGSRQELFEMSGDERAKTVELHRPYIDEITLKCPECGGTMHRVPEVIDCWFRCV